MHLLRSHITQEITTGKETGTIIGPGVAVEIGGDVAGAEVIVIQEIDTMIDMKNMTDIKTIEIATITIIEEMSQ